MTAAPITNAWVVIPAAGTGARFGGALPKQYALLQGEPILLHTIRAMQAVAGLRKVIVALAEGDNHFETIAMPQGLVVDTIAGGSSRAASVLAGLRALQGQAADTDWILVHDAARPLVSASSLEKLQQALRDEAAGGLLAVPVHDTVKQAGAGTEFVERTLDRQHIWLAQTPQMFRYRLLAKALESALAQQPEAVTDEASAMELAGHRVRLVEGDARNLKITTPQDLQHAEYLFRGNQ